MNQLYLGRYHLQERIAVGGMAELFLAQVNGAKGFEKQVVVKRMRPKYADSREHFQMFVDEARIAASLQHPNVVQVYDAGEVDGEYFMAMEYLDGTDLRTLRRVLADEKMGLPWEHAIYIVVSVASALHYTHEKCAADGTPLGIVHRDATPHNIFLTREGGIKLVDFGIAKSQDSDSETAFGTRKGKLSYMSPEQCNGGVVDRRSDIYTLGVVLYELTTGQRLYKSRSEYKLIKSIVEEPVTPPSELVAIPSALEDIILRCLEKRPEDRYQSARELQAELEHFARDYQLMFSSLSFSAFLEPLLGKAKELQRPEGSNEPRPGSWGSSSSRRRGSSASWPSSDDQWAAGSAVNRQPSQAAAIPTAYQPLSSSTSDAVRFVDGVALGPAVDEPMTKRVPEDMLERIRREERELIEQEKRAVESDAIPRPVPEKGTGSVSRNVVRRSTNASSVYVREDQLPAWEEEILDDARELLSSMSPSQDPGVRVGPSASELGSEIGFDSLSTGRLSIDEAMDAAMDESLDIPITEAEELSSAGAGGLQGRVALPVQEDMGLGLLTSQIKVGKKRGNLVLVAAVLLAGAGIGSALYLAKDKGNESSPAPSILDRPEIGSLTVTGDQGQDVWLHLGRAPIDATVINGTRHHLLLVEHEGFGSETVLIDPDHYEHDAQGNRFAAASVELQVAGGESENEEALDLDSIASGGSAGRPARLVVDTTPSAAKVWVYVGKTPDVQVGNLDLSAPVELRIGAADALPSFKRVPSSAFDSEGKATLNLP